VFVAAHELRTPVAAMKGYLELILGGATGGVNDATREYIEKIIASDKRLVALVNDLLEVARSEAGRLTIKVAPTDIAPAIRGTLDELRSLADEKSIQLIYEPSADLPKVMADADRIKEVTVNLVGNAIKYMGGAGTVTVTHERVGGDLITHIADTGLGIPKDAEKKLFEKFYRVQTEKTKDITGTGLGLFIVREIIEKMGGTIQVASEEGKGSIFSFGLPVVP
jgi:signal transduction histidine kinase